MALELGRRDRLWDGEDEGNFTCLLGSLERNSSQFDEHFFGRMRGFSGDRVNGSEFC